MATWRIAQTPYASDPKSRIVKGVAIIDATTVTTSPMRVHKPPLTICPVIPNGDSEVDRPSEFPALGSAAITPALLTRPLASHSSLTDAPSLAAAVKSRLRRQRECHLYSFESLTYPSEDVYAARELVDPPQEPPMRPSPLEHRNETVKDPH